jgi:hypothetical protein
LEKEDEVGHIMVIKEGSTTSFDLLGCFYDFRPVKGQTVREWCEKWGYRVDGNNESLKKLFGDALVHTGLVLSWDEPNVLDNYFE